MIAHDLLIEYLDYTCFWSRDEVKNDQPALIRRKQLEALLQAFGLTKAYVNPLIKIMYRIGGRKAELSRANHLAKLTNIEYFKHGEFLHDRVYEDNKELTSIALKTIKEAFPDLPETYFEKPVHLGWLFNDLINFRQEIYKLTYPWGGMLEGFSVGLHYSKTLTERLQRVITQNVHEIDQTLCLVIDPYKRTFDKEELVTKYGYPDVDIDDIDRQWRIDNY